MTQSTSRHLTVLLGTAALAAALWATPLASPALGRIEGTVRLTVPTRAGIASGAYAPRAVTRPSTVGGSVSDVIVFLRGLPPEANLPLTREKMVQQDEAFEPRVIAITKGSTVDFPNADPFFHNVFSLSSGAAFDLGRYRRGDSRSRVFTHAGLVKVYCHVHSDMSASILVLDTSHFTRPDAGGAFSLPDLPAGTYRLSAWQERLGETVQSVKITPGETSHVEFNLPLDMD